MPRPKYNSKTVGLSRKKCCITMRHPHGLCSEIHHVLGHGGCSVACECVSDTGCAWRDQFLLVVCGVDSLKRADVCVRASWLLHIRGCAWEICLCVRVRVYMHVLTMCLCTTLVVYVHVCLSSAYAGLFLCICERFWNLYF